VKVLLKKILLDAGCLPDTTVTAACFMTITPACFRAAYSLPEGYTPEQEASFCNLLSNWHHVKTRGTIWLSDGGYLRYDVYEMRWQPYPEAVDIPQAFPNDGTVACLSNPVADAFYSLPCSQGVKGVLAPMIPRPEGIKGVLAPAIHRPEGPTGSVGQCHGGPIGLETPVIPKEVTVTVSGLPHAGKSVVIAILKRALEQAGITAVLDVLPGQADEREYVQYWMDNPKLLNKIITNVADNDTKVTIVENNVKERIKPQ